MAKKSTLYSSCPYQNIIAALIILLAIAVRIMVFVNFPVFITNDSGDYLSAGISICKSLDFFSDGLRDARLPGYPVFLALISCGAQNINSDLIVIAQIISGVISVILGLVLGSLLQSRILALGLSLFLALNPFYLLTEHMILPETLYLLALLGLIIVGILAMRGNLNGATGFGFGVLFAVCNLLRANGLILCLVLLAGTLSGIVLFRNGPLFPNPALYRRTASFLISSAIGVSILVGPWLARNYYLYQKITMVNYMNRNLLIYKTFHGVIDPTLPLISRISQFLVDDSQGAAPVIDYEWFARLADKYPSNQAEQIAADILEEQINHDPLQHRQDILESFRCFGGICQELTGGRADVRFWFTYIVSDAGLLNKNNTQEWITTLIPTFQYIPHASSPLLLYLWSRTGLVFFNTIRPLIYRVFFTCFAIFIITRFIKIWRVRRYELTMREMVTFILGVGYLVTVALHATTLAAADRYAAPFDIISISAILLVFQLIGEDIKARK